MLLEINFTLVLFAVSFLIFIYLLNLTLYKPVGEIIEKRKTLIEDQYEGAKESSKKANEILENYKSQIKQARSEAQNHINEGINQSTKQKEEKISKILTSLNTEKELALKKIKEEQKIALHELEAEVKSLSELITNKIVGGNKTLAGTH